MGKKDVFYRGMRGFFKPLFLIVYRPKIINREAIPTEGAVLLCGNHKHALDPILVDVCTDRIVRTLAKKDLFDGPFGFVFRGVRAIPVDLHKNKNPEAYIAALEALRLGNVINISPEAKRNFTDEVLLKFKYGAVSMGYKTGTKIIPYSITGKYKIGGHLTIEYGEPITVSEDLRESNERLYDAISKLLLKNMDSEELERKHLTPFSTWDSEEKKG